MTIHALSIRSQFASVFSLSLLLAAASQAAARPVLVPGDMVLGSRGHGTVYGPVAATGQPSGLLTGPDLSSSPLVTRGTGPSLAAPQLSLLALSPTQVLARPAQGGLVSIDVGTGNRTLLAGTNTTLWSSSGDLIRLDRDNILVLADDYDAVATGNGKLLKYSLSSGAVTVVSGGTRGNGVVMHRPKALAQMDANTVAVVELGPISDPLVGSLVYQVDLTTGDRTVISSPGTGTTMRYTCTAGVVSASPSAVPPRGTGPLMDAQIRGLAYLGGSLYISGSLGSPFVPFIMKVDPATGNRTLVGGTALNPGRVTVLFGAGSTTVLPDSPTSLIPSSDHSLIMCATFGPNRVWELDINTRQLLIIADLDPQILTQFRSATQFSGLSLVPSPCSIAPGGPEFLAPPQDVSACAGTPAQFAVQAAIFEPVTYQWRKGTVPIDPELNPSAATPTLAIDSVTAGSAGTYDCVVTDACATAISGSATLHVLPDLNGDLAINTLDLILLLQRFGQVAEPGTPADINQDGSVNTLDLILLLQKFGQACP